MPEQVLDIQSNDEFILLGVLVLYNLGLIR